ncbi:MAG: nuclear transport factor 2 family protein [Acidimicrobiales bacterium]
MGRWSREELETEFDKYQARAPKAATSHDWREWADQFTEDATYIEHHYGVFGGREAIYKWIQSTMDEWPNNEMIYFPIDWYVIDEDKGWVICRVFNRFADPGDGSVHQEANITILKYAGNGLWSLRRIHLQPRTSGRCEGLGLRRKKELADRADS